MLGPLSLIMETVLAAPSVASFLQHHPNKTPICTFSRDTCGWSLYCVLSQFPANSKKKLDADISFTSSLRLLSHIWFSLYLLIWIPSKRIVLYFVWIFNIATFINVFLTCVSINISCRKLISKFVMFYVKWYLVAVWHLRKNLRTCCCKTWITHSLFIISRVLFF